MSNNTTPNAVRREVVCNSRKVDISTEIDTKNNMLESEWYFAAENI